MKGFSGAPAGPGDAHSLVHEAIRLLELLLSRKRCRRIDAHTCAPDILRVQESIGYPNLLMPPSVDGRLVVIDHQGQRKTKAVGTRESAERVKREIEVRLANGASRHSNRSLPKSRA